MKKRVTWIDCVKGFAMILVVLGHCGHSFFYNAIYYVHLPIFVITSGYLLFLQTKEKSSKDIVRRRIETLMWPYFTFGMMRFAAVVAKSLVFNDYYSIYDQIMLIIGWENNANWFLPPLFIASLLYLLVNKKQQINKIIITISLISSFVIVVAVRALVSLQQYSWLLTQNIYLIGRSFAFFIFMEIGVLFCNWFCVSCKYEKKYYLVIAVIVLLCLAYYASVNSFVDLHYLQWENTALYYVVSLLSACSIIALFIAYEGEKCLLSEIGKETLIINGTHISLNIVKLANYLIGQLIYIGNQTIGALLRTSLIFLIEMLLVVPFFKNFLKWMLDYREFHNMIDRFMRKKNINLE